MNRPRHRPSIRTAISLAAASLLTLTGCGASVEAARGASIEVVTGLYPIAQAAQEIGAGAVTVTDVVPAGSDPRAYHLTPAQGAQVRRASVVILAGPGFQPSLDAAASGAPRVLDLQDTLSAADPYVWLDPQLMVRAIAAIAASLEAADPTNAGVYRNGARAFSDQVASTGIDYQSTLSVCPRRTIVTADGAFLGMAHSYGLKDQVAGATATSIAAAITAARSLGVTTAFSEPFVDAGPVKDVAAGAHLKLRVLDPLTGPPPGGWPGQANYLRLMEANLGALNSALGCPNTGLGA